MTTRKIENPFYTATLEYDETKTETDYEKELVNRYADFLQKMQGMRETMKQLKEGYYHEELLRDEIAEPLEKIKERYEEVDKAVKKIIETQTIDAFDFPRMRDYFFETNAMYVKLQAEEVEELRGLIDENQKVFTKIYNWFEVEAYDENGEEMPEDFVEYDSTSGKVYEYFDKYASELYKNYDAYSLDLCSFDEDVDNMKGAWQEVSKEWDDFFDFREKVLKNGVALCEKITNINTMVEAQQKKIDELDTVRIANLN